MLLSTPRAGFFLFLLPLLTTGFSLKAQTILPDFDAISDKGVNILMWNCQYEGLKNIAVQRSADSTFNWSTIGYVKNLAKGPQAYVDGHPLPGKNWYRLNIAFSSDLTWFSNTRKLNVDSTALAQQPVMPPNDALQNLATKMATGGTFVDIAGLAEKNLSIPLPNDPAADAYSYIKSQFVFTNPFTGHINVEVDSVKNHTYTLAFFDQKDQKVLAIDKISEPVIIIDKRNFQRKGLYKFELMKDKAKLETGFVTIY